ncbi:MAG: DNA adenine methylase [Polyangiaceae bacterium]
MPKTLCRFDSGGNNGPREQKVAPPTNSGGARRTKGFIQTRYLGSKRRLLPWLESIFQTLEFDSAVDVFGGTGAVSWALKRLGKSVVFNDALEANAIGARAVVANDGVHLPHSAARTLFERARGVAYADVVERHYAGVFYVAEEDRWIDTVAQNAHRLTSVEERSLALHALFQACLMKRPFNLFHRANLSLRLASVQRSFGNKATWDTPFEALFLRALDEANAAVFRGARPARVLSCDALTCPLDADLVYLDPPYVRADGASFHYGDGYHFLEGLADYGGWASRIDASRRHKPLSLPRSAFEDARTAPAALEALFDRAERVRHLVFSYRADGLPSVGELVHALERRGRRVTKYERAQGYALSTRRSGELVLVATRDQPSSSVAARSSE